MSGFHDETPMPPVDPPTYPGSSGGDAQLGDLHSRVRRLEAVPNSEDLQVLSPVKFQMIGVDWRGLIDNSPSDINGGPEGFQFIRDSTAPGGGYILSGASDGNYITFGLGTLGPAGSGWAVSMWAENGSDKGKTQIEWATTSADESQYGQGTTVSIADPAEANPTFYHTTTGGASPSLVDWYSGGTSWGFASQLSALVVNGADGEMLSGNGIPDGDWFYGEDMDGGGDPTVAWWVRIRVDGKNASSSSYVAKIAGVTIYRLNANAQPIT